MKKIIGLFLSALLVISSCFTISVSAFDIDIDVSEGGALIKVDSNFNNGFETYNNGFSLKNSDWFDTDAQGDSSFTITGDVSNSGTKALKISATSSNTICRNIVGLTKNTWYRVTYYWMMPNSPITATPYHFDRYHGSVVADNSVNNIEQAYNAGFSGDYSEVGYSNFTGNVWNKTTYVFNTGDDEDFKLFIKYSAGSESDAVLYFDDFSVDKLADQSVTLEYKAKVSTEGEGFAYISNSGSVEINTEITAIAAPKHGYQFDGWYQNGVLVSNEESYTFRITADSDLTAKFVDGYFTPDINNDGSVNLSDVVSLAQKVVGWNVTVNSQVANVNGLGRINLSDVVLLAQYVAGWEVDTAAGYLKYNENLDSAELKDKLLSGDYLPFKADSILSEGNQARFAKLLKKAQNGEDITFVSFGGSITEGAGRGDNDGYTDVVAKWFEKQFPNISVTHYNMGIGSTSSLLGVHRLEEAVLQYNPDFVVVDFTINDGANDTQYTSSYESIIRRILEQDNAPAVLGIMFGSVNVDNNFSRNPNCQSTHLTSLKYYGVPVIDYYGSLWKYFDANVINWRNVSDDSIHPNAVGHKMAGMCINYYLDRVLNNLDNIDTTIPEIPQKYFYGTDIYQNATLLTADNFEPTYNNGFSTYKVHRKLGNGWNCNGAGTIKFTIENARAFAFFPEYDGRTATRNGTMTLKVNGVTKTINCSTSTYNYIWVVHNEKPGVPTTFEVEISVEESGAFGPLCVAY